MISPECGFPFFSLSLVGCAGPVFLSRQFQKSCDRPGTKFQVRAKDLLVFGRIAESPDRRNNSPYGDVYLIFRPDQGRSVAESRLNILYGAVREGDSTAEDRLFQALSERFGLFVQQRVSNAQDAEEIVQETLMAIAQQYGEIDFQKSFAAWAYRILENKLLYYYRTKKSQADRFVRMTDEENPDASMPDPLIKRKLLDCLKKKDRYNARHSQVLNLHYQGYTVEEISGKFDTTKNNVYILLSRSRSMLKTCIETGDIK